jgi:WhiB family redox-sensing transcriptional regulator
MEDTLTPNNLVDLPFLKEWGNGEWRKQAACANSDTEKFFPTKGKEARTQHVISSARLVCARCPVRSECLEFAVKNSVMYGIWGGLTREERKKVKDGDYKRASRNSPNILLGALRKLKFDEPMVELASILNIGVEEARRAVQHERNNRV